MAPAAQQADCFRIMCPSLFKGRGDMLVLVDRVSAMDTTELGILANCPRNISGYVTIQTELIGQCCSVSDSAAADYHTDRFPAAPGAPSSRFPHLCPAIGRGHDVIPVPGRLLHSFRRVHDGS